MKSFNRARSSAVNSALSACIKAPFIPCAQHSRRSCKYAPRPANFPVGSTCTPSAVRTIRTICLFGKTSRHPTQVLWGTCFTRWTGFFVTFKLPKGKGFIPNHCRNRLCRACVSCGRQLRQVFRRTLIRRLSSCLSYPSSFHHLPLLRQFGISPASS